LTIAVLDLVVLIAILGVVIYYGWQLLGEVRRTRQTAVVQVAEAKLTRELLQKLADDTLELEHADGPIGHQALEAIRRLESPPAESTQPVVVLERSQPVHPAHLFEGDPNEVISPPPVDGGRTIQDMARYYTFDRVTWPQLVSEFVADVTQDPKYADFFHSVDNVEEFKKHFTNVIVAVNKNGVTRGYLKHMYEKHRDVRDLDGNPITDEIYNGVIDKLANVLYRHGIPVHAVNALANTVKPLKDVIVVAG
jgi:hypothetical protein